MFEWLEYEFKDRARRDQRLELFCRTGGCVFGFASPVTSGRRLRTRSFQDCRLCLRRTFSNGDIGGLAPALSSPVHKPSRAHHHSRRRPPLVLDSTGLRHLSCPHQVPPFRLRVSYLCPFCTMTKLSSLPASPRPSPVEFRPTRPSS